jgi:hypothetical protein
MGYFSNGSEGTDYEMEHCAHCLHGAGGGAGECPVWFVHLLHNGQTGTVGEVLERLIPRDLSKPGSPNGECAMFMRGVQPDAVQDELPL